MGNTAGEKQLLNLVKLISVRNGGIAFLIKIGNPDP